MAKKIPQKTASKTAITKKTACKRNASERDESSCKKRIQT